MDLNNLGVVGCQEVKIMQALARDGHPLCKKQNFWEFINLKKNDERQLGSFREKKKTPF